MAEKEKSEKAVTRRDPFAELDWFEGWDPFRELRLPSRLRRLFDEAQPFGARGRLIPAIDVAEDDGQYVVTVELPGIEKDDVTIEAQDNVLTIRGEKKSEREERKEHTRWTERCYGSFSRSFTLPANAQADRVRASFKNGVLTIEIPKAEEKKPKVISIKS
jgi:HSP20 family protein